MANGLVAQFIEFVRKYGVLGLAIGFVTGGAATDLVKVLTTSILEPLVQWIVGLFGKDAFSALNVAVGDLTFKFGDLLLGLVNFLAIMGVIFLLVKFVFSKWMTDDEKKKV